MFRRSDVATAAWITLASITLAASSAWAIKDPETGVNLPDKSNCGGQKVPAVAVGAREATMGIDVYAVAIYASPKAKGKSLRSTSECVKIVARFVRDVGADKIREAWVKGLKRYGVSSGDAKAKKMLGVITGEIKKGRKMVMIVNSDRVHFAYTGKKVNISGAAKLAKAIKSVYLGPGSPTPTLVKDLKKRGLARP